MSDFIRRIPEGDDRERMICADYGHIAYANQKIAVGSVVVAEGAEGAAWAAARARVVIDGMHRYRNPGRGEPS